MVEGKILKVSGPLVIAEGMREANMFDVVRVGEKKLIGEIIEIHGDKASIQVYEETAGIGRGDAVVSTGAPLSVELGPGLITNIYDGIQRPLEVMREKYGSNIIKGIDEPALDRTKKWHFTPMLRFGDGLRWGIRLLFGPGVKMSSSLRQSTLRGVVTFLWKTGKLPIPLTGCIKSQDRTPVPWWDGVLTVPW